MLTEEELNKIFSWLPYRNEWPVNRNEKEDNIIGYYGKLIESITHNNSFETYYSEDGGLANYLEFVCYLSSINDEQEVNAILVCISLCAPIAVYGQITIYKTSNSFGSSGLFSPNNIGIITDNNLLGIEKEIKNILLYNNLGLLDKELASKLLPLDFFESSEYENHNKGNQYLHGIFQIID